MTLLGTQKSILVASVMLDIVVRTAPKRSALLEMMFLEEKVVRKVAIALVVESATMLLDYASVSLDISETGANTRLFSAKT